MRVGEIVCISPIDGREVARRATAIAAAIEQALQAARAAQREWVRVPLAERVRGDAALPGGDAGAERRT